MSDQGVNEQAGASSMPDKERPSSPGAQLAGYRKERGWTIEQVASQLNLAPRQVVAIESDDYNALPGMAVARGFIRAYAKLLKVDAAPLLAMLGGETAFAGEPNTSRRTLSTPFSDARLPSMTEKPSLSSKWIIGLLLAVLLGVALWASQLGDDIAEISKTASSQVKEGLSNMSGEGTVEQQTPLAQSETPAIQSAVPGGTTDSATAPAGGEAVAPVPNTIPGAVAQPSAPTATQPVTQPSAAAPADSAAPAADNALVLKVREDSWVEIRRASGNRVMLSRIVKAGETESIEVKEPILVVIGNASGVDVALRGAPIELKPATKSNVARLNLK